MIYTFVLLDKANAAELRQQIRPEHRAYMAEIADRIAFAGGLKADDGDTSIGSLLAIDFESREAATDWLSNEPFTRNGLYASIQVFGFLNHWPQRTGFPPE